MRVTKYELSLRAVGGQTMIDLRFYSPDLLRGYSVIESVSYRSGESLPGLRKHAKRLAAMNNATFVDRT